MRDVALLERYRDGGIAVYDELIQSFKDSKGIIGNVSMSFEDIVRLLELSRHHFSKLMIQYMEVAQNKSGGAIYERDTDCCLSGKG